MEATVIKIEIQNNSLTVGSKIGESLATASVVEDKVVNREEETVTITFGGFTFTFPFWTILNLVCED